MVWKEGSENNKSAGGAKSSKWKGQKDSMWLFTYLRLEIEDHALQTAMLVLSSHVHICWTFFFLILILDERQ